MTFKTYCLIDGNLWSRKDKFKRCKINVAGTRGKVSSESSINIGNQFSATAGLG